MTTPQEFVGSFLRERAAVYAEANTRLAPVYAEYFGEPLLQNARDFLLHDTAAPLFEEVKQSGGSAVVVTREHFRPGNLRLRYHLGAVEDTWKIIRIERECFSCHGAGRSEGTTCHICNGEGWYDRRNLRVNKPMQPTQQ